MPQIINTNIASLNAQRNLNKSQSANQTALQRLSSGLRINSAKDDAAGLAISTRFNSQIRGLNVAVRNAGDGISLAQTAEGALGSMSDNLQRVRELAVQSANATNSDVDRDALQAEVAQLLSEVSRTAEETDFNGRKLLDGSFTATFQIGANAGQTLDISIAELTADKLGAAASAGLSATGSSEALQNGDLTINGIAIDASKAGDDTASTANADASAIAKVEAINEKYDQTGVKAQVNSNVVSGAEMVGANTTGNITLNGVDIAITTTLSTSQTRAGVADAINALSDQTGVRAVNSETDAGGVELIADDGRNIQITFSGTLEKSSTGVGVGLADGTGATGTFEGGYTLVADSDVSEIVIQGGNGTGNGDLSNAGLTAGTYARGTAISVSEVSNSTASETKLSGGTSTANLLSDIGDSATLITGGAYDGGANVASAAAGTVSADTMFIITQATGASTLVSAAAATEIASAASLIDAEAGIAAFERITFSIDDFANASAAAGTLEIASSTITLGNTTAAGPLGTEAERLESIVSQINNTASFKGGSAIVTAELNAAKTEVLVTIDNYLDSSIQVQALGSGAVTGIGDFAVSAGADFLVGNIAFETEGGDPVTLTVEGSGGSILATDTLSVTDFGDKALSSTGTNQVNVAVDGTNLSSITVDAGSTVNDLASAINTAYTADGVNAWEDISLTFDATNLEVGDTIYLGTAGSATAGVALGVNDTDGTAGVGLQDLVASFNSTDFSAQNIDVSATYDPDGNSGAGTMTLNIRNYSGSELGMVTDADGRSLTQETTNNLIGSVEQQLSGVLAYSSKEGQELDVNISNPDVANEFFANNSSSTTYAGVNGLDDGDVLINDVSIGAALVGEDKASAEFASDGTKILSSSKEQSGIAIAAAINKVSAETGVEASVNSTEVVGGDGSNADTSAFKVGDTAEIYINGYSAGAVTLQADSNGAIDTDRAKADALSVINSAAGKTGVAGVDNGVSLTLNAEDGRNISIAIDDQSGATASIGALFGLDADVAGIGESTFGDTPAATNNGISAESATYETTYSTVTLKSAGEFTVAAGSKGADELEALGLSAGSYGGAVQGQFLKDIDISTFEGATAALTSIDNAIGAIASQRADLGAIQNRMESTVSNLAITSENLSAANSRIQDADFAAETAELSRTQVLQQAGISILAQANQGPQQVLSLLG